MVENAICQVVKGVEELNLDSRHNDDSIFQRVLKSIERLNVVELRSILQANPNLDLCQRFETKRLSGLFRDFNFAPGTKLKQNLYLFCFNKIGDPAKCGLVTEMIQLLHQHRFICTGQTVGDSSNCDMELDVRYVVYIILRKLAIVMSTCSEVSREVYQNLSALVSEHSVTWFQAIKPDVSLANQHLSSSELWKIDLYIAVELREYEKVGYLLKDKENLELGALLGPVLDKYELAGPPVFIAYPAVWLAMMNRDMRMIQLLSPSNSDIDSITKEPLLLLKIFRRNVRNKCLELIKSKLSTQLSSPPFDSLNVLAISLIAAAEREDYALIDKELYNLRNCKDVTYRKLTIGGHLFMLGSCRKKCFCFEDNEENDCVKAMNRSQLQNRKSLSIVAVENADVELLHMLHAYGVPLYNTYIWDGNWMEIAIYSSVFYDAVRQGLERQDYEFLDLLLSPGIGDSVTPLVVYHAVHQNDMELVTILVERYGDSVMHRKVEGGKTCHQISLLEFKECSPTHRKEVQERLIDKLNESNRYKSSPELPRGTRNSDLLTITEITNLSRDKLSALLESGDYTKVRTWIGIKPLLQAYLEQEEVPYNFEFFCTIKEKLKSKDTGALANISHAVLRNVLLSADAEFILKFLSDDDVQMDLKIPEHKPFHEHENPLSIFKHRLESDERLEQCVEPFLSLFEGNPAFSRSWHTRCFISMAMLQDKKGSELTTFEKKLLDNTIEWLSNRHDCLPRLADFLTNWDERYFEDNKNVQAQLKAIFQYIKSKKPDLLTATNELGMNLAMYCADLSARDYDDLLFYVIDNGPFDINAKAEVSSRVTFELQHIHGKIIPGKKRNTLLPKGQTRVKEAKMYNQKTGKYQSAVDAKFQNQYLAFISRHPMTVNEGTSTKISHVMLMGKVVKRRPTKGHLKASKRSNEDIEDLVDQSEFVPEHLQTTSLFSDGSGLRSRRGRRYKMCSDVETQAADLGGSNLEDLLTPHYAVNTNILSLSLKSSTTLLPLWLLSRYPTLDLMHRDNDKVSPLILAVKNRQRSFATVNLLIHLLDQQISKLSVYGFWVKDRGVRSTRDYLLQDFDESDGDYHGKTARQIAEECGWSEVVELIESRLNAPQ